jgi:hypothetical protein
MTPREFDRYLRGRDRGLRDEYARGMSLAWHAAAFQRGQKIPDLKPILDRITKRREPPKTPAEQLRIVEMLNAKFGGRDLRQAKG